MEDEIDLRHYTDVVAKHWKWVLGLLVVAVALAALVSDLILPPVYETAATVRFSEAALRPGAQPGESTPGDTAIISEAKNAAVRRQILAALGETLPQELRSLQALDQMLYVLPVSGRDTVQLMVRHNDPQEAADIANTWATVLVEKAQKRYDAFVDPENQLNELQVIEENLHTAEQALVEFHQTRSVTATERAIQALTEVLADYGRTRTNIALVLQLAESLKQQLQASGPESSFLAGALSPLLVELNELGEQSGVGQEILNSLEPLVVSGLSVTEQVERLDNLITALRTKHQALVTVSEETLQEVLKAQGELQEARLELNRLQKAWDEAQETYEIASEKVDKARLGSEPEPEVAWVVSVATAPVKPILPKKPQIITMAGMLALFTGLFGAFVVEYLRQPPQAGW